MTASDVRQVGSHAPGVLVDAAAEIANKAQDGAAAPLAAARVTADEVGTRLPGIASAGAESVRMPQELTDPRLELLAAFSLGVGAGLWLAGAPRLIVAVATAAALLIGAAIALRPIVPTGTPMIRLEKRPT